MDKFLVSLVAGLLVEMAKSAGHEAGIRAVAALGPHLSAEMAGKVWTSVVERARRYAAEYPPTQIERLSGSFSNEQPPLPVLPYDPASDEVTERYPLKEKGPG